MTRLEFIKGYAARSGIDDKWAALGFICLGSEVSGIALPCVCEQEGCEGWAMVTPSGVTHHLEFNAPEPIRSAFIALSAGKAIEEAAHDPR